MKEDKKDLEGEESKIKRRERETDEERQARLVYIQKLSKATQGKAGFLLFLT